jgi:hypothetical protein
VIDKAPFARFAVDSSAGGDVGRRLHNLALSALFIAVARFLKGQKNPDSSKPPSFLITSQSCCSLCFSFP